MLKLAESRGGSIEIVFEVTSTARKILIFSEIKTMRRPTDQCFVYSTSKTNTNTQISYYYVFIYI